LDFCLEFLGFKNLKTKFLKPTSTALLVRHHPNLPLSTRFAVHCLPTVHSKSLH